MKSIIYYLSFIIITFYSCQGQEKKSKNDIVKIQSLKNSVKCMNYKEKYFFEFPDVFGKNENNFFNNIIIKDYSNYLDIDIAPLTPKKIINLAINNRKKECNNNNFSGLTGSYYDVTFNNSIFLSITMNYESIAGTADLDSYYYNFDVSNKKILVYNDILKENKIIDFIKKCNAILKDRLKELGIQNKVETENSDEYKALLKLKQLFSNDNLDSFSISDKGITFIYNYGFQNGVFDIDNNLYFSYKDFQKYTKEDFQKKIIN
ncbi:hypothetical protein [Flavobacterium sp.]|uniref:hypothetical protein n=1 Tax=Flavobacterium sp. TaxID=239 RepID=UPI00286B6F3F|nr:hypothetical protein [Flavobacterium sp.]